MGSWGLLLLALGCSGKLRDSGEDQDTGQAGEPSFSPRFSIKLGDDALDVRIRSGQGGSWWMGLAETTTDTRNPWLGEDCYQGDRVEGSTVLYCHRLSETGGSLRYGGDPLALLADEETALSGSRTAGELTYYFYEVLSGDCWVGGDKPDYYAAVCTRVVTIPQSQ